LRTPAHSASSSLASPTAALLAIVAATGCRPRSQEQATKPGTPSSFRAADSAVHAGDSNDLFYGVSREGIAWLLAVNTRDTAGFLYEPLGAVSLCDLKFVSSDSLTFRSAVGRWACYRFAGHLDQDTLEGVIWVVPERSRSRTPPDSFHLALSRIRPTVAIRRGSNSISGVYSNVWYHEGAGDLLGEEILLVEMSSGLSAATILYEGSPDWPRAPDSLRRVGDTVYLWQPELLQRRESPDTAIVRHDTVFYSPNLELPLKASLSQVLQSPPRFKCT